ncbi:MAG: UDP-glucose/GDP-mannose dehydrogenase family protein [Acidobacteria bacterium]|nr:UDP-glucose/GDP-mannose dehydrogenase family protein [Acidobacteriota bacterium]
MNISVVGTGYVGLVTGTCFADLGVTCNCIDKDKNKIDKLNQGEIPIFEPGLQELVEKNVKEGRLSFTTDIAEGVKNALVIFIAVGTPQGEDGSADLQYVDQVAKEIANNMDDYKVIVTKSTVPVGTGQRIRRIIKENLKSDIPFDVVSNPEFLREGSAIGDFMRPDRVIIGTDSEQAEAIMKDLYRPLYLIETPIVITNIETSEMIKYASNAFLAVKISYINDIANLCERVGADVHIVAKGMGLDGRIGPKFLHPGPGYGGSCFPKDTKAIVQIAQEHDYELTVVKSAIEVNENQRMKMVDKIVNALDGDVKGKTIGFLGLAFKPNTDDMRESPTIAIIKKLQKLGAKIKAYDPASMKEAKFYLKDIEYVDGIYEAIADCDAMVLATEWNQFKNLDFKEIKKKMKQPVFLDLRNVYGPARMKDSGFKYYCVGRAIKPKNG